MLLADSAVQIILSINMQPNSVNSDPKKKKEENSEFAVPACELMKHSWWSILHGV